MDNYLNKEIYKKAKAKADNVYEKHSAYKSMYLSRIYQEMGGKYKNMKTDSSLKNWRDEKWIQVSDFLINGTKKECGSGSNPKGCRPTIKIDKNTPITINELIKKHGKKKLLEFAKKKKSNMDKRANWNNLVLT
jgi:hypothetical protein